MKQQEMAKLQDEIFEYCRQLRGAGQKEYAHDDGEAFANFHRVAHSIGVDRKKVLWTYLEKHLDGIKAAMNGHQSQREPVYSRIGDAIVYLTLLYGMFLEEEKRSVVRGESPVLPPPSQPIDMMRNVAHMGDMGDESIVTDAPWLRLNTEEL